MHAHAAMAFGRSGVVLWSPAY